MSVRLRAKPGFLIAQPARCIDSGRMPGKLAVKVLPDAFRIGPGLHLVH